MSDADAKRYATITAALSGDPEARYHLMVADVVAALAQSRPVRLTMPAELVGVTLGQVHRSEVLAPALARWRLTVTRAEAIGRLRLQALAQALAEIRARDSADAPGWAERAQFRSQLERHLRQVWRLEPPPAGCDVRTWACEHARRYDLLPRAWRQV
jgi:hypothetical protein